MGESLECIGMGKAADRTIGAHGNAGTGSGKERLISPCQEGGRDGG